MQRIRAITAGEHSEESLSLVAVAERRGAPDPRVAAVFVRLGLGRSWLALWNRMMGEGALPPRLKELVRIRMSMVQHCGYCSSVRSRLEPGEQLSEETIGELGSFETSSSFTSKEKAALAFCIAFKADAIDSDAIYEGLCAEFDELEVLELAFLCSLIEGGGKIVKLINVVSWDAACALNPNLQDSDSSARMPDKTESE